MRRIPYESTAAPTSHSATDPAEFNAVCRSKPNLPNKTDSNAALLLYLTQQLGSAHEWSGVWNRPESTSLISLEYFHERYGMNISAKINFKRKMS